MNRFARIFIIVNLLLCYTGLYNGALAVLKTPTENISSGCHTMSHSNGDKESEKTDYTINNSTGSTSCCCDNGLLNAPIDQPIQVNRTVVQTINVTSLNNNIQHSKIRDDRSMREHDPPDLQIANSTFLL